MKRTCFGLAFVAVTLAAPAYAWDSDTWLNVTHATHSYLTEAAIDANSANYPELEEFRTPLVRGANTELHELEVGFFSELVTESYGIDLEAKRVEHIGTNEGTDDIAGWWQDAVDAYAAGNKEQAYFYTGVMLHMIEDMGVPAHAHYLEHQGMSMELNFDNLEYMGLSNWNPEYGDAADRTDPGYDNPSDYYAFSQEWALADSPNYTNIDDFSKTWTFASEEERKLLTNRQLRTSLVTTWALASAARAFGF